MLGNHKLNAILFHTLGVDGVFFRDRSDKNADQHRSIAASFASSGVATPQVKVWVDWFLTLPLWHDLNGLRLVHACWAQAEVDLISKRRPNGVLAVDDLAEIAGEKTDFAKAVKTLTCERPVQLPGTLVVIRPP